MRLLAAFLLLSISALGQDGIPDDLDVGLRLPGITSTSIDEINQIRIDALEDAVQALQARVDEGLDTVSGMMQAQEELAIARLDITHVHQERLDLIEDALLVAVLRWQRTTELMRVGVSGSDAAMEAQNRADVYRCRVLWLKEKASAGTPLKLKDGIPKDVGTVKFPKFGRQ